MSEEKEVRRIIGNVLGLSDTDKIGCREDLGKYGLDSLNCIEILIEIEEHYKILVPEEYIGMRNLNSIYDICRLIKAVLNNEQL